MGHKIFSKQEFFVANWARFLQMINASIVVPSVMSFQMFQKVLLMVKFQWRIMFVTNCYSASVFCKKWKEWINMFQNRKFSAGLLSIRKAPPENYFKGRGIRPWACKIKSFCIWILELKQPPWKRNLNVKAKKVF